MSVLSGLSMPSAMMLNPSMTFFLRCIHIDLYFMNSVCETSRTEPQ
jgi:hypothetical protein